MLDMAQESRQPGIAGIPARPGPRLCELLRRPSRVPDVQTGQRRTLCLPYSTAGKVEGEQVYCPKVGWIELRLSRPVESQTKSASFKTDATGHWHVCLIQEFDLPRAALPQPKNPVGVDLGLIDFATFSNGESIPAPRFARKAARRQRRAQRVLSRRKKGGHRRKKAKRRLEQGSPKGGSSTK